MMRSGNNLINIILYLTSGFRIITADVRMPPAITLQPVESKIYRVDEDITLDCRASGTPPPQYEWRKNGLPLGHPSNVYRISEESIQIKPLSSLDEGYYQCVASNEYGTALSRTTVLRRAVLSSYSPGKPIFESPPIQEGQPYTLKCNPTKCHPKATYSWAVAKTTVDEIQASVLTDNRIQIDEEGSLHFSYVTMADAQDQKLYKCNVYNPHLDITIGGSYSRLNVIPVVGTLPQFAPTYLFSSPSPVIALEGHNVSIRCFFAGNPIPSLRWSKAEGSLPMSRREISNRNSELTIHNVQQTDEGDYLCHATNYKGPSSHIIQIDVQAVPIFKKPTDRPQNMNVTEGDSVTLSCDAYAVPKANIVWMRNGIELDVNKLPSKYRLTDENRRLHISNLCKNCADGSTDLAVIQCNASNPHGYAFGDGYINVLKKTLLMQRPEDVYLTFDVTSSALFECNATSDDSTPPVIRWYHVYGERDVGGAGDVLMHNVTNKVILGIDGSLNITISENTSDWAVYRGLYKCVASNGYSQEVATASLRVEGPVTAAPIMIASLGDWWWVFLLIALILLLVILLICCCICVQRNRGDSYPVDQKERKNGNNPVKELADSGFHDYQRLDGDPFKGSRVSLGSSMKMDSDGDEASLNEYGDIDAGKFTEDGSFIGDYGTDRRRPNNFHV